MLKLIFIPLFLLTSVPTNSSSAKQLEVVLPFNIELSQNIICPNSTDDILADITITYTLKETSSVSIHLLQDKKRIAVITEKPKQARGSYTVVWCGRNDLGECVKDGLYDIEFYINGVRIESVPIEVRSLIAKITIPKNDVLIRGQVPIFGIACGRNFKKYIVEYANANTLDKWIKIEESTIPRAEWTQIEDIAIGDETIYGNLATWDTGLTNYYYYDTEIDLAGSYIIRLTAFNDDGSKAVDEAKVEIGRVISFIYGGGVESPDEKVNLYFPEHAIKTSFMLFNIQEVASDYLDDLEGKEGYKLVGKIYEIEPEGISFARPAVLTMHYNGVGIQDETRIGIYLYKPDMGIWKYLPAKIDKKNSGLVAEITSTQNSYAYCAIFERLKDITSPILYDLPHEAQFNIIDISGESEPDQRVKIYINGKEKGEVKSDVKTGIFKFTKVPLEIGRNEIKAKTIDEFENVSPYSKIAISYIKPNSPAKVYSLGLKNSDFEKDATDAEICVGSPLFIELTGEDADKDSIDTTPVRVNMLPASRNLTEILLLETGFHTGIYRAVMTLPGNINITSLADPDKRIIVKGKEKTTLETEFDGWKNLDGEEGAVLSLDNKTTPDGSYCLKLSNEKYGGSFGVIVRDTPFDVTEYSIIKFDYKIPPEVKINFLVKAGKRWYDIQFTDDDKIYERINMTKIGEIEDIVCDNEWHHAEFNLYKMLKKYTSKNTIEQIVMADYDVVGFMKLEYGHNPQGATFYMDNFVISKQAPMLFSSRKIQPPWEIGKDDNSNNEFLYETDVEDDYYVGDAIEDFERAVTRSDPRTNIHFYISKENLAEDYNFLIKAKSWDVRHHNYIDFDILLNSNKIASLQCPYKDGTAFNVKVDKGLKKGWNILSLEWKGGGEWISWDYLKFEPVRIKNPSSKWVIGYNDDSFNEFSHEINVCDDYSIGEDLKNFERAISIQDPITNIKFYLAKDMLNTNYELFIKLFDIDPIDIQPKVSGAFFKVLVNGETGNTYNVGSEKESLQILILKDRLKEGENIITLKWLAGCDWIAWDYIKFGPVQK